MSQPGKSILLVDDDQEIRELLETYLSRVGFQVRAVADGAAFRQSLCAESADLVILDVMLPDEDGFSLCRWVREHQRFAQVPVIMLTASSDEADRVIGLEPVSYTHLDVYKRQALDPETTESVLALLADINRRLGITIVLITHELEVVRAICDHAALLERCLLYTSRCV